MPTGLEKNILHTSISYNGRLYFTSQYFHNTYRDLNGGKKYALMGDFNRLIRSIETYSDYIERGDIVELEYDKEITDANIASVHKSIGYKPIMLISATVQVALTHHLDDEVSKRASVNVNVKAAEAPLTGGQILLVQAKIAIRLEEEMAALKAEQKATEERVAALENKSLVQASRPRAGYAPIEAFISRYMIPLSRNIVLALATRYDVSTCEFTSGNELFSNEHCTAYNILELKSHVNALISTCQPTSPTSTKMFSDHLPAKTFFVSNMDIVNDIIERCKNAEIDGSEEVLQAGK